MTIKDADDYKDAIQVSGQDIYSPISIDDGQYWIPTCQLEFLLNRELQGLSLAGKANRTRSKVVKESVCSALGYPVPDTFKKTQPRFAGQQLDTYVQKSMNLQIWNEKIDGERRYAIIQVSENDVIKKVRVITGLELARLDSTGTLTSKYQARFDVGSSSELISALDTPAIVPHLQDTPSFAQQASPIAAPESKKLLPIRTLYSKLNELIGQSMADPGADQERNRGAALHRLVCSKLGYQQFADNGQFPDLRHQLLEIKLQTSPTIDLGLVLPNSQNNLDVAAMSGYVAKHCDTRYAVFFGDSNGSSIKLTHVVLVTGADFFNRFRRFEGNTINRKLQIKLPSNFFG